MNLIDYAIVSDFDGTITLDDTNDTIFLTYGTDETRANEDLLVSGLADYRSTITKHFEIMPLNFEQYYSYLDTYIRIDPGFRAFYKMLKDRNLPFYIVSGGFIQAISHILKDFEIPTENIFSNSLTFEGRLIPSFAHNISVCNEEIGPCGNCKKVCLDVIKKQTGKKIMFIGDGFTDFCAVKLSDYVFAKSSLIDFCEKHGIEHQKFTTYDDIIAHLENLSE